MISRLIPRLCALLVAAALLFALAACTGGGGGDTTPPPGENPDNSSGSNELPPINFGDGPIVYPGKPTTPGTGTPGGSQTDLPGSFNFGPNIFRVPVDSQGAGRVNLASFSPGQKVAFVVLNTNPDFLDAQGNFTLPDARYSIIADLVSKGSSSAELETLTASAYSGMEFEGKQHPFAIYEREAHAQGKVPFAAEPVTKSVSLMQRGEVRTFVNVEKRDVTLPTILPGPDSPDRDTSEMMWPQHYDSQDGRLVGIGQHCLIFLSTEINGGNPDHIRFTQQRINRMAQEFDTVIWPILTTSFGPVRTYAESAVWRDIDRNVPPLTGDDFGSGDPPELLIELPGRVDQEIILEQKVLIFIFNGDEGGFFAFGPAEDEQGRERVIGSTLYIGSDNFPANDNDFNAAFSIMAHEFQHKLYADNGLPFRNTSFSWFNEGLSQLAIHLCGYTANSGKIIHWAIDSQVVTYLQNTYRAPVPMDNIPGLNQAQYGSGFLFFLYLYEHYDPGVGERIYQASRLGERSPIRLVEAGAQSTEVRPGTDGVLGTADDQVVVIHDTWEQVYTKFAIANFVDGIYAQNEELFDDRFHYNTIDLRGTVNLSSGSIQLPGVRVGVFPQAGTYPVTENNRPVSPWGVDYIVFGGGPGDGRDLEFLFNADRNFKIYMLPVQQPTTQVAGVGAADADSSTFNVNGTSGFVVGQQVQVTGAQGSVQVVIVDMVEGLTTGQMTVQPAVANLAVGDTVRAFTTNRLTVAPGATLPY